MRRADALARLLRRADYRAVLLTTGLLLGAVAAQAAFLWAFVASESLEEADRWAAYALQSAAGEGADERSIEASWEALRPVLEVPPSMRVLDSDGRVIEARGPWPPPHQRIATAPPGRPRRLGEFTKLRAGNYLVGGLDLGAGRRMELALPLASFCDEAREIGLGLAVLAGVSGLAALGIAGFALSRAFAPLRRATRLVERIDATRLGERLVSHGTGDPVDRHAEALNRLLADADASFDRLRAFSADVAHELRTPLNRLQNLAEVALLGGQEAEFKPALERVHAAAQELSQTIRSLLLLAELDDRRFEPQRTTVDLDEWMAAAAELYGPLFEERGATLEVRGSAGILAADRQLLDRVLGNLLENALRHGAGGGRVEMRARRDPTRVVLEVDDAGPGIPAALDERVFDRFARLDPARSGPGAGLGLAVARACARVLGGDLRLGGSRLGGACFVFTLPSAG